MPLARRLIRSLFVSTLAGAVFLWVTGVAADRAAAQYAGQRIPSVQYVATFGAMYEGDYLDALKSFRSEGRGAVKSPTTRWIDSICYHAMSGECCYEMGQLSDALEHYTAAVQLYVAYSDWMVRVNFPPTPDPARPVARLQPTWPLPKRPWQPASFRDHYPIGQGQLNAAETFRRGGIVQAPVVFDIDVVEVVRCTALAIRRRTELLGPTCRHDALTGQLLSALAARPGVPNHWSECWIDVQLGLAERAAGKDQQAERSLQRGLLAAGQFDHPLTGVALFELGKMAMARGDMGAAADYFAGATGAAAYYGEIRLLEEAFRYGAVVHLVASPKSLYPPLGPALEWAKRNRLRQLACSLLVSLAENHASMGQTPVAATEIAEASKLLLRRDMAAGRLGTRHAFVSSRIYYQQKNVAAGDAAVTAAMRYMGHGSHWLFHMTVADRLYVDETITPRVAMDLYAEVLRDPQPKDWSFQPDEAIASLLAPHSGPLEHWFEVAMARKDHEAALEISDRARRHRFFRSLPFGGRLESLRWMLEGPQEVLSKEAQLHRRDLALFMPGYDKLSKDAVALRESLHQAPPAPTDAQAAVAQKNQLAALAAIGQQQEMLLREVAVSRQPADLVFPPLRSTAEIQKSLPQGTAILAFFATQRGTYVFLMNNARYDYWPVAAPATLTKKLSSCLRALGQFDPNSTLTLESLKDTRWQAAGREVLDLLLQGSKADFTAEFEQLIVVPDGLFWYVPFEALQVEIDDRSESLISRFQIRYAPTVGLAVPDGRRRKAAGRTGVVLGRLFPRDGEEVSRAAFDELAKAIPNTVALPAQLPSPSSVYRGLFDGLIVYDDVAAVKVGPYAWEPIPVEGTKPGNMLADWLALPWGGPQTVILPGFHTAAESGLKRSQRGEPGEEMFLSVCGLMASGARTVLLSRWRTGGQISFMLVREFAQELPHTAPAEAWQRAVLLARDSRMEPQKEPRLRSGTTEETPKAEHPFFWAGYMLVDPGDMPATPAAAPPAAAPEETEPEAS